MPCEHVDFDTQWGRVHMIICGRRAGKIKLKCIVCGHPANFLCDYIIGQDGQGKNKTCDKPLCKNHTNKPRPEFGQPMPDIDYCPEHWYLMGGYKEIE